MKVRGRNKREICYHSFNSKLYDATLKNTNSLKNSCATGFFSSFLLGRIWISILSQPPRLSLICLIIQFTFLFHSLYSKLFTFILWCLYLKTVCVCIDDESVELLACLFSLNSELNGDWVRKQNERTFDNFSIFRFYWPSLVFCSWTRGPRVVYECRLITKKYL